MVFDECDIIERLKEKDESCVRMMFDRYYHALCMYALRYVSSLEDAEDVVQNVFVSFWQNKRGTSFEGSLQAYLFGAVAKSALKVVKKYGRMQFDDIEDHVNQFLEEILVYEEEELCALREKLAQAVDTLPEKSREIFKAIVLENLSYKEVAVRYNVSVNTVKTQYSLALKKLREYLGTTYLCLALLVWGFS